MNEPHAASFFLCLGALSSTLVAVPSSAKGGAPRLIDTLGIYEIEVAIELFPDAQATWVPRAKLLIEYDGVASEDVIMAQWKQGGKALGKPAACSAGLFVQTVQHEGTPAPQPANLAIFNCAHPKEAAISAAGTFVLELTYKQTLAGSMHDLGALEFTVLELKQGSQNKPRTTYALSHDHRMTLATIEEAAPSNQDGRFELENVAKQHHDMLLKARVTTYYRIRFWTKYKDPTPEQLKMSCLLDGKKVTEGTLGGGKRYSYWTHQGKEREAVTWTQQTFNFEWSRVKKVVDESPQVWIWNEHPGDYRCIATSGGEIVKEVFFTIGPDGKIVPSPCQAQVNALRHIQVLRAKDGLVTNTKVDQKLSRKGFFGRVTWKPGCPAG